VPETVTSAVLDSAEAFSAAVIVTSVLALPDVAENERQPPELSAMLHSTPDAVMDNVPEELSSGLREITFGTIESDCPLSPDIAESNIKAIIKNLFIILMNDVITLLIKLPKVNYLSPDCQGFLINIAGLLTIIGNGTKSGFPGRIITLLPVFKRCRPK